MNGVGFTIGAMSDHDELTEDPCRAEDVASGERSLAFVLSFVVMIGGGVFATLSDSFYLILLGSVLGYTASVALYSFARNKGGNQPFLFTCPVVVSQYPRLLKRHVLFLAVLTAFVIIALRIKPHLTRPFVTSSGRDSSPFYVFVGMAVLVLALTEIVTNRGVLERAHNDRFGEPPEKDENARQGLFGNHQ